MQKVAFITPPDVQYGFNLSGVSQYAVETAEAEKTLQKLMADPETGLIIIDERSISAMTEERLSELEHAWRGILLVLPSPVKPPPEIEDYAAHLIRRAIGYHVRLKL